MQDIDIHAHFNAPKLRIDTWNILASLSSDLYHSKTAIVDNLLEEDIKHCLSILKPIEYYHAFPGIDLCQKIETFFYEKNFEKFHELISLIVEALRSRFSNYKALRQILHMDEINQDDFIRNTYVPDVHYFEVLFVEELTTTRKEIIKRKMESYIDPEDKFIYEFVFVKSFDEAIIACMFNFDIKCCLITDFFTMNESSKMPVFENLIQQTNIIEQNNLKKPILENHAVQLGNTIKILREHELGIFYLSSHDPEKSAATTKNYFDKIFYEYENYFELHLSILQSIVSRYETPFFDALKKYAHEPKSTFHALPIARGKSVFHSKWIHDMQEFYGKKIFIAESSATAGGLDSLINPVGSIKQAMIKAANYFGSQETFFVTSGSSASTKILLQTLLNPNDIVLIEHSCHESHYYGLILTGANPIILNGYRLKQCDITGAVSLRDIKEQLLSLKKHNLLDRVKMLILTNCTFDGLVYNVQKYMEEILAIKPDMIFVWDEAWFAYARCVPHYRLRTAMHVAAKLQRKYSSCEYREEYNQFQKRLKKNNYRDEFLLNNSILPDPDEVKVRVYSTQSIHKTLSCFRQGSMIHIFDSSFEEIRERFIHAFISHTTTSPNYQILATMDLARRQAELEGFELVQNAIELSMIFRQQVNKHPLISQYFQALGPSELILDEFRQSSHVISGYDPSKDWGTVEKAWLSDDIVIDPTRVTLMSKSHLDGYTIRTILMNRFGIQINKVSLNTILIQFNIGTLRSSVSYLLDSLYKLSNELYEKKYKHIRNQKSLLLFPDFSGFASRFRADSYSNAGQLREAFYAGQIEGNIESIKIINLIERIKSGEQVISASIIIPIPPGYPVLLPGQIITEAILKYLQFIDPTTVLGRFSITQEIKVFKKVQ